MTVTTGSRSTRQPRVRRGAAAAALGLATLVGGTTTAVAADHPGQGAQERTRSSTSSPTASTSDAAMAAEVLRLVNVERKKAGCDPVHRDGRLEKASRLHSEDMATNRYFGHDSRDGRSPWDRMRAQGYHHGSGENIAAGQRSAAAVMESWMKSAGHRRNILSCDSKAMGVGIARGGPYGVYWTQGFGRV